MKKLSCLLVFFAVIAVSFATVSYLPVNVKAITLFVGGGGPGNYTTIRAAIDNADPGDTVFVYSGTYHEEIIIDKTLSLVGENRNTTIINGSGTFVLIDVSADWVNITGFTVTTVNPISTIEAIYLYSVRNCNISKNQFRHNGRSVVSSSSSNIMILDNIFTDSLVGISLSNSDNSTIAGNTVSENMYGMTIYSSANVIVTDNDFHSNEAGLYLDWTTNDIVTANTFISDGISISGTSVPEFNTHIISNDNEVNGKPVHYYKNLNNLSIDGAQLGQLIIVNCTDVNVSNLHINDTGVGIEFGFVDRASIARINLTNAYPGIYIWYSERTSISKSTIWNGTIYPWFSNNIIIADNTLEGSCEIHPFRSANVTIANNTLSNCGQAIFPQNSENLYISNNELLQSGEGVRGHVISNVTINGNIFSKGSVGVRTFSSTNITIVDNEFLDNEYRGIRLQGSSDITITRNNIVSSGTGVGLENSSPVLVHHNNFINNTPQANDDGANTWDDDYPSGGNYWSDYAGVDNCSGPNQDICPDPDGIGDTPYVIDANSTDRYPLMSPEVLSHTRPPTELKATLAGASSENVHLTWSLSPDDGMRLKSVIGYYVYRNTSYNRGGRGYLPIAYLPNGTSEFMDISAGEGNSNNYFYRVCAVDVNNNTACSQNQAGKSTHPLPRGRNLISIPLIQSNKSIERALQTVKWDKAWSYNSISQEWKSYMKDKTYRGELLSANLVIGLWINVTEDCSLTVAGIVPASTSIHLVRGWNLVSFPSLNASYTVADLKAVAPVERVESFDSSAPPHFLCVLVDSDVLLAGQGYWVKTSEDATWVVSNV